MAFQAPYHFRQNTMVVVQGPHGNKHLRIDPQAQNSADAKGAMGKFAHWHAVLKGNNVIQLKSAKTNKFLRIFQGGNVLDVAGGGGKFCDFRFEMVRHPNVVKLQSCVFPRKYVGMGPQGRAFPGGGGPHCVLIIKRQGGGGGGGGRGRGRGPNVVYVAQPVQPVVPYQGGKGGNFDAPYLFKMNQEVVMKGHHGKHMRVHPQRLGQADGHGGTGEFARWRVHLEANGRCKIQSVKTGKYLRIHQGNLDVGGGGGKFCIFQVHHRGGGKVALEGVHAHDKHRFVKIKEKGGEASTGKGGKQCEFRFLRRGGGGGGGHATVVVQPVVQQQQVYNPYGQVQQMQQQVELERQRAELERQKAEFAKQQELQRQKLALEQQRLEMERQRQQMASSSGGGVSTSGGGGGYMGQQPPQAQPVQGYQGQQPSYQSSGGYEGRQPQQQQQVSYQSSGGYQGQGPPPTTGAGQAMRTGF